jgi:hypothetical protein
MVLPQALWKSPVVRGNLMLFVGDDWAEQYHDVQIQRADGRRLAAARLPEGAAGVARLHVMISRCSADDGDAEQVLIGIETDRGPWVPALTAAGYRVYAINPLQVGRHRERTRVSGAQSDRADAHLLADMVRIDAHRLRVVAGDFRPGRGGEGRRAGAQDADLPNAPATCCGCARRCGTSSPPRWRRSRT